MKKKDKDKEQARYAQLGKMIVEYRLRDKNAQVKTLGPTIGELVDAATFLLDAYVAGNIKANLETESYVEIDCLAGAVTKVLKKYKHYPDDDDMTDADSLKSCEAAEAKVCKESGEEDEDE